jgi:hypothetical protein
MFPVEVEVEVEAGRHQRRLASGRVKEALLDAPARGR